MCPNVNPVTISAMADTGAQSCLWSMDAFLAAGFLLSDLIPVKIDLVAANKSPIRIEGAIVVRLSADGADVITRSCATMVYISRQAKGMYISMENMMDLAIIPRNFPNVGATTTETQSAPPTTTQQNEESAAPVNRINNAGCSSIHDGTSDDPCDGRCSCPQRTVVPERPKELPFECKPENNEKMKGWLLQHFGSSTFNTCHQQPCPQMSGPPMEIHMKDGTTAKAFHTPAPVLLFWQKQVEEDLFRDEELGIIERVPYGEPIDWCHRMMITAKHDNTPRRTVDLSPLNGHCMRETFASESPFHVARRIPSYTWKQLLTSGMDTTVYHCVSLTGISPHSSRT